MRQTHTILNDDLNQNVQMKKTEVQGNTIVSVVTIWAPRYLGLETDPIAQRIENELNEDGYDVEVIIHETDDDTHSQEDEEMQFLDQKWVATALIIGAFVSVGGCIALLVLYYISQQETSRRKGFGRTCTRYRDGGYRNLQ
eukprot:205926_1